MKKRRYSKKSRKKMSDAAKAMWEERKADPKKMQRWRDGIKRRSRNPEWYANVLVVCKSRSEDWYKACEKAAVKRSKTKEWKSSHLEMVREVAKRKHRCPHCGRVGKSNTFLRWHFNNCRTLKNPQTKAKRKEEKKEKLRAMSAGIKHHVGKHLRSRMKSRLRGD
jgi:hypothetical protein